MPRTLTNYARSFGATVIAGVAVVCLSWFLKSSEPTIIKSYTENGREVTLLDHDGDLSTVEERVTRGRFAVFGSETPEGGYVEKREFEPQERRVKSSRSNGKVNTETSVYDKGGKWRGTTWQLEPREERLEIPEEEPEVASTTEVEEDVADRIRRYLNNIDFYRLKSHISRDMWLFTYGEEENYVNVTVIEPERGFDKMHIMGIDGPAEIKGSNFLIRVQPEGIYFTNTFPDRGGRGEWTSGHIEGEDVVIDKISKHCDGLNGPLGGSLSEDHKVLHEYDDLEVGQRLSGLGKKIREIYEALNEKAKEVLESRK